MLQVSPLSAQLDQSWLTVIQTQRLYPTVICFLTCRHEQMIDYVTAQTTNSRPTPSKFYVPERLKLLKSADDEQTKTFYSPSVGIIFPQVQKFFPSVLSRRRYPVSLRMPNNISQRIPSKHEKTSRCKFSKEGSTIVTKTDNLEENKRNFVVRKKLTYLKVYYSSRH